VIPARVLTKPPSAELRPDQKDSDSLPEYDLLDPILKMYVEEDKSVPEMAAAGYPEDVVRRVVTLVDRSEYKRRQAPPASRSPPAPWEGPPDADHQRVERIGGIRSHASGCRK